MLLAPKQNFTPCIWISYTNDLYIHINMYVGVCVRKSLLLWRKRQEVA